MMYACVLTMGIKGSEDLTNIERQYLSYVVMGFATLILVQDIVISFYDTLYSIYEVTCLKFKHAQTLQIQNRRKK